MKQQLIEGVAPATFAPKTDPHPAISISLCHDKDITTNYVGFSVRINAQASYYHSETQKITYRQILQEIQSKISEELSTLA